MNFFEKYVWQILLLIMTGVAGTFGALHQGWIGKRKRNLEDDILSDTRFRNHIKFVEEERDHYKQIADDLKLVVQKQDQALKHKDEDGVPRFETMTEQMAKLIAAGHAL